MVLSELKRGKRLALANKGCENSKWKNTILVVGQLETI